MLVKGETPGPFPPLSLETPSGLNLCRSCVCCHSLREFICAPVLLYLEDTVSLESPTSSAPTIFLPLVLSYLSRGGCVMKSGLDAYINSHSQSEPVPQPYFKTEEIFKKS